MRPPRPIVYLVALAALGAAPALAQGGAYGEAEPGRISLSVVTPESYAGLNTAQLSALRGKIVRMVTAHGLSGDGYDADLVIYPTLDLYGERTVEGLQTLTVVEGELSLHVKNLKQNLVFASFSLPLQGHGKSRSQALTNAIRGVKTSDRSADAFFDQARARIVDYYEAECDNLLDRAYALMRTHYFDEAFSLVVSVPTAAPDCYRDAQAASVAVFEAQRDQGCGEQVQAARAAATNNQHGRAMRLLANVDPSSACHAESVRLMRSVEGEVDARDRRYYEALQEAYRTAAELEGKRIDAARDVAVARAQAARRVAYVYATHRRPVVTYRTLVSTTVVR